MSLHAKGDNISVTAIFCNLLTPMFIMKLPEYYFENMELNWVIYGFK